MSSRSRRRQGGLAVVMDRYGVRGVDLAEAVGVYPETVSRWRAGARGIGGEHLVLALEFLRQFEPTLDAADLVVR